jgi:hypothetical protein
VDEEVRPERSPVQVVLGGLYALLTLPLAGMLLFASVFAVSPTICPEVGGSYLCTSDWGGLVTLAAVGALLLGVIVLGIAVPFARTGASAGRRFAGSVACAVVAIGVIAVAGASWA